MSDSGGTFFQCPKINEKEAKDAVWQGWAIFGIHLAENLISKLAQMFVDFLAVVKNIAFKANRRGYFLENCWKNLGYFLCQHLVIL